MSHKITNKNIVDEMQTSFLDYAMSVIVARALPDVRDGLKPVQRRILFAMNDLGNYADKPYKKSARIVGDVIGKYHPHGDSSVYMAMVRMAQDFSYRMPLIDGHGNFGSIDGDGAAAMRYTEARMSKLSMELLKDIKKETVDFQENYDGTELEPVVLPARIPNLLVNGANGIAVGMATNIPPHNLGEVISATIALIQNPEISDEELWNLLPGPDFPLGGLILGDNGIKKAYKTGHGRVVVRSKYDIIEDSKRPMIVVKEIPYQVNKAQLVERIAECVKNKIVDGIRDLRDESDKDGIRIVIELKQHTNPQVVLNSLFKHTALETSISINMLALNGGVPQVMNLRQILQAYINHQIDVLVRKLNYELKKAQERAHILNGLVIAVNNIDAVVDIIRHSETTDLAKDELIKKFNLSEEQAKAILDMQLKRLTGLESDKLCNELTELETRIRDIQTILASQSKINECIVNDLTEIKNTYKCERRTEILKGSFDQSIEDEDLIAETDVIITLTKSGYIKRVDADSYKAQGRGGTGIKAMTTNDEDSVERIVSTTTHTDVLFFTQSGKVYKQRAHRIPEGSRQAKGIPLVNIIDVDNEDLITNILAIKNYDSGYLLFITKKGKIKKTKLDEYVNINKNGKRAIKLEENDTIVSVLPVSDEQEVIAASKNGKAIHIAVDSIRAQGRVSSGVRLLKLVDDDEMIDISPTTATTLAFSLTKNGYGKATPTTEYRLQGRGGKGIKNINITEKNGEIVAFCTIEQSDLGNRDLLIITKLGKMIRITADAIKVAGRATQGIKMMRLKGEDSIAKCELVEHQHVEEQDTSEE